MKYSDVYREAYDQGWQACMRKVTSALEHLTLPSRPETPSTLMPWQVELEEVMARRFQGIDKSIKALEKCRSELSDRVAALENHTHTHPITVSSGSLDTFFKY